MLERIEHAIGHKYAPPVAAGALLAALDVGLVPGVFAMVLFVVTLEAVKRAVSEGVEDAVSLYEFERDGDDETVELLVGGYCDGIDEDAVRQIYDENGKRPTNDV